MRAASKTEKAPGSSKLIGYHARHVLAREHDREI